MNLVMVCRRMGWTWTELMDQPDSFVRSIIAVLIEEAKVEKKKS